MGKFFSDKVETAVHKIYKSYSRDEIQSGFDLLLEAGKENDGDAYYFLAKYYTQDDTIREYIPFEENDDLAGEYIKKSILCGSALGVLEAVHRCELPPLVRKKMPFKNLREAFDIVLTKAESGCDFCQVAIADTYYYDDIIQINGTKEMLDKYSTRQSYQNWAFPIADEWYIKSFQNGLSWGFLNYTDIQNNFTKNKKRINEAIKILADADNPEFQDKFADILFKQKDYTQMLHYLSRAEEKNYLPVLSALISLGDCYIDQENYGKALSHFLKLIKNSNINENHPEYCKIKYTIARLYFLETADIQTDHVKSFQLFQELAASEYPYSYVMLGYCYQHGNGIDIDYDKAFFWLSKALEDIENCAEPATAYYCLGNVYAYGWGAEKDISKGISFYDKAIAMGNPAAKLAKSRFRKKFFIFGDWVQVK